MKALLIILFTLLISCGGTNSAEPTRQTATPAVAWEGKLVRRGGGSVEDAKVYFVENGKRRWVISGDWIRSHGFKWPDDVNVISAADLDQIPLGDPVQQ